MQAWGISIYNNKKPKKQSGKARIDEILPSTQQDDTSSRNKIADEEKIINNTGPNNQSLFILDSKEPIFILPDNKENQLLTNKCSLLHEWMTGW